MRQFKHLTLITLLLANTSFIQAQLHWESLVLETDTFRYLLPTVEPAADWMVESFNDSAWKTGIGGFGYADDDDNTVVAATTSIYLRKTLTMPVGVPVKQLLLDIDYDDAFVAYINGVEVARSANLLEGTPSMDGSVTVDHEAVMYSGGTPERFVLDPTALVEGDNILAVHIMNVLITSSDLSSRIFLNAETESADTLFHPTPDWFEPLVSHEYSNLPIIKINTNGLTIPDEPKIMAKMQVINNSNGTNYFSDTVYEYDGDIGIEIRGNTAQMFPKKSYTVETRLSTGENNNVPLLGFPTENDWVFHGPYSDKSLMRNALAYHIGNTMGKGWHPRSRFVEMEINGEYSGVYLAVEKIKIDKNRVDIAKLNPADTAGDQLTGGYIISIDRDQEGSWNSPFMGRTGSVDVPFSYVDPKYDELTVEQRAYIREYITDFEYALNGAEYKDPLLGYRAYIDVISFIDYFIITELSKDLDGYRVSVFFHKDKDSKGGRLTMTPFWDYNLCFGNANFFDAGNTTGWASTGIGAGDWYEIPFWWDKFRTDPYFETLLKIRWQNLRKNTISKAALNTFIDSMATSLADAQVRNFEKFDILNTYVWPNNYVGGTYENEIAYLKSWISSRIDWIDVQIASITPLSLSVPTVNTLSATDTAADYATIGGDVLLDGNAYVWERGLFWAADTNPRLNGKKIIAEHGTGQFYVHLDSLLPDTKYYYIAYAENDLGRVYGEVFSFRTKVQDVITTPSILSLDAQSITTNSATIGGKLTSNGGDEIIERGVFWHTETFPELFGTKVVASSADSFTIDLDNLTPDQIYFYKAYATNSAGTSYGEQFSFTTLRKTDTVVPVNNPMLSNTIIAYPNPFTENVTIKMDMPSDCHVEIRVVNSIGELVHLQSRDCSAGTNQFFITGSYFIDCGNMFIYDIVVDGSTVKRGKLVKL